MLQGKGFEAGSPIYTSQSFLLLLVTCSDAREGKHLKVFYSCTVPSFPSPFFDFLDAQGTKNHLKVFF